MTEQKIREAFEKWWKLNGIEVASHAEKAAARKGFKAGYMALLNELVPHVSIYSDTPEKLYRLPKGVTKP
jgi:hypothetical protein